MSSSEVIVIGAGLAGCEAAWQLAKRNIKVVLHEMRGVKPTPAHVTEGFAELVCSNSFRSDDINNAVGLLHHEMRNLDSLIMRCADKARVPAGSALAVDRVAFSQEVENALINHPNITAVRGEVNDLSTENHAIIASGPLTSDALSQAIIRETGEQYLAFFDAIAPIIHKDTIDFTKVWFQSRYDKGEGQDYINCPMNKEQYYAFVENLKQAEKIEFKEWEKNTPYFNGCLPIEVMAERGDNTLRFGPMKPVGLTNPHSGDKPYAVVQLRQDNKAGTLYNMVGFQTKLKYPEQQRIFKTIPGLENVEFARLGGMHRNTFINSPVLLDKYLRLKSKPSIRFAGQITGVEGYLESAACGLLAGIFTAYEIAKKDMPVIPEEMAIGAMLNHITENAESSSFQPMNINFGLFPEIIFDKKTSKDDKKKRYVKRALEALNSLKLD